MQSSYDEIIALIETFCNEKLNDEYLQLCKELTAALTRKRPSPLVRGKTATWSCGIVYVIGQLNFLFDPASSTHIRADELCAWFGVAATTGGNKARLIRDLVKIKPLDSKWMLPGVADELGVDWMVMLNGFPVDARRLPRPLQEEALRLGLIPYVPENDLE
jgi:hypothetical protein